MKYLRIGLLPIAVLVVGALSIACSDPIPAPSTQPEREARRAAEQQAQFERQHQPEPVSEAEAEQLIAQIRAWVYSTEAMDFVSEVNLDRDGFGVGFIIHARVRGEQGYTRARTLIHGAEGTAEIVVEELIAEGLTYIRVPAQDDPLAETVRAQYNGLDDESWYEVGDATDTAQALGIGSEAAARAGFTPWRERAQVDIYRSTWKGRDVWVVVYEIEVGRLADAASVLIDVGLNAAVGLTSTVPDYEFAGMLRVRQVFAADSGEPIELEISGSGETPADGEPIEVNITTHYPAPDNDFRMPEPTPLWESAVTTS